MPLCVELALGEKGQLGPGRVSPRKATGSSVTPRVMPACPHCLHGLGSSRVEQGCHTPRTPRFVEKGQGMSAEAQWNDGHGVNFIGTARFPLCQPCHPGSRSHGVGSLLSEPGLLPGLVDRNSLVLEAWDSPRALLFPPLPCTHG